MEIEGGCLCGKVRYSADAEPAFVGVSHCGKALYRRFCPECGSSVIDEAEAMPNMAMIMAGTPDDASWVKPAMEIYLNSAQPWVSLGGERPRFPKMPPAPG